MWSVTDPFSAKRVEAAYDVVAEDYQASFGDDLDQLPLDRRMLDQVARSANDGLVLDLGCGTGTAGSYVSSLGARVVGLDLSFGMLRACGSAGGFSFVQGDMRQLPFESGSFAAVVCYYSIQHLRRLELSSVLEEAARVIEPGGTLLLGAHLGEGEVYMHDFLGHRVSEIGGTFYSSDEISQGVAACALHIESTEIRGPLSHEYQSQRLYLLARRQADTNVPGHRIPER